MIFSVNDGEYPNLTYHRRPGGLIICRGAASARTGCGMRLPETYTNWSVLFPVSRLEEAPRLVELATTLLDLYSVTKEAPSTATAPTSQVGQGALPNAATRTTD